MYTWNPNDPCFDWKRPCFGGVDLQKQRSFGLQVYIYICIWHMIFTSLSPVSILVYRHDHTVPYIMVGFLHMDLSSRSVRLGTSVSWCCSLWLKLPWSWIAVGCWLCCCCRCSWEASKDGKMVKQMDWMFFGLWSPMISMFRTNPAM